MKTCHRRQSFRRRPRSSNWQRCKRCEPKKELNREKKCVWAGNTHTGASVLPGESSHIILELILFEILKISKVRVCGGGTRFFPNEHIPYLSQSVLGLSSPTFWVCIWLSRQQLIIIKQVGVLEQWRRGGRGSGIPPDQLPVLASGYFARFHDEACGGGQKGTYVWGGGYRVEGGIWTGPWLTLVLLTSLSVPLDCSEALAMLSSWALEFSLSSKRKRRNKWLLDLQGLYGFGQNVQSFPPFFFLPQVHLWTDFWDKVIHYPTIL